MQQRVDYTMPNSREAQTEGQMPNETDRRIEQYIEQDPHRPGRYNARLRTSGVHVWALVGHLQVINWDVEQAARDYDLPREAVEAALAYYHQHKAIIDARIEANLAPDEGEVPMSFDRP
jgi:uncharacterized protein (DUF433 family)